MFQSAPSAVAAEIIDDLFQEDGEEEQKEEDEIVSGEDAASVADEAAVEPVEEISPAISDELEKHMDSYCSCVSLAGCLYVHYRILIVLTAALFFEIETSSIVSLDCYENSSYLLLFRDIANHASFEPAHSVLLP
jgi:hypothetical protein